MLVSKLKRSGNIACSVLVKLTFDVVLVRLNCRILDMIGLIGFIWTLLA